MGRMQIEIRSMEREIRTANNGTDVLYSKPEYFLTRYIDQNVPLTNNIHEAHEPITHAAGRNYAEAL